MNKISYLTFSLLIVFFATTINAQIDIDTANKNVLEAQRNLMYVYESGNQAKIQKAKDTLTKEQTYYNTAAKKLEDTSKSKNAYIAASKKIADQVVEQEKGYVEIAREALSKAKQSGNLLAAIKANADFQKAKDQLNFYQNQLSQVQKWK
jgi:predicted SPOUT superfamily RNA methylase MTH1